jgi:hypothetical protein
VLEEADLERVEGIGGYGRKGGADVLRVSLIFLISRGYTCGVSFSRVRVVFDFILKFVWGLVHCFLYCLLHVLNVCFITVLIFTICLISALC